MKQLIKGISFVAFLAVFAIAVLSAGAETAVSSNPQVVKPDIIQIISEFIGEDRIEGDTCERKFALEILHVLEANDYQVADSLLDNVETVYIFDFLRELCEIEYGNYFEWSVDEKYRFDKWMVEIGQLPYCFNLMPPMNELSQEEAFDLGVDAIRQRYGIEYDNSMENTTVSYCMVNPEDTVGIWRFRYTFRDGISVSVHVYRGKVTQCKMIPVISNISVEYDRLCSERGAFFKWSIYEKAEFAYALSAKLDIAQDRNETIDDIIVLEAIAEYGFCLPCDNSISQADAYDIASEAVKSKYGLKNGWDRDTEVYFSYFCDDAGICVWRIIFWKTGNSAYASGVVDMDAHTGEVFRIEKNGTKPNEFIPYIERL